jgi:putative DNA methylase
MDALLDQAHSGPVYLRQPEIAVLVADAIQHGQETMRLYDSHAWVVMPNHVHLLITPLVDPSKITQTLKRFTARDANRILSLSGPFWQPESYDHLIRDRAEFEKTARYIHMNPVRAGLAAAPNQFPWSSAAEAD